MTKLVVASPSMWVTPAADGPITGSSHPDEAPARMTSPTIGHSVAWLSPQKRVIVARRLIVLVTMQEPCGVELIAATEAAGGTA